MTEIPISQGYLALDKQFLEASRARDCQAHLEAELDWRQDRIRLFGRQLPIPRLQAWHGEPGCQYRYSGLTLAPRPWTPTLQVLRAAIEERLAADFNAVLANLYRDGSDSVGWHADDEPELGPEPLIASLSLGAPRRFCLRHRHSGERHDLELPAGSLVVMGGSLQHHWLHALPKTRRPCGSRINLSFRQVRPQARPLQGVEPDTF